MCSSSRTFSVNEDVAKRVNGTNRKLNSGSGTIKGMMFVHEGTGKVVADGKQSWWNDQRDGLELGPRLIFFAEDACMS